MKTLLYLFLLFVGHPFVFANSKKQEKVKIDLPEGVNSYVIQKNKFTNDLELKRLFTMGTTEKCGSVSRQYFQSRNSVEMKSICSLKTHVQKSNSLFSTIGNSQINQKSIRMDSVISHYQNSEGSGAWMETFQYSQEGKDTIIMSYEKTSNSNKWVLQDRVRYEHNSNGQITKEIRADWDSLSVSFKFRSAIYYYYDDKGNLTEKRYYQPSKNEGYMYPKISYVYEYDEASRLTQYSHIERSESADDYIIVDIEEVEKYTYNSDLLVRIDYSYYDSSSANNDNEVVYYIRYKSLSYNSKNKLISIVDYFDLSQDHSGDWRASEKTEYEYNTRDQVNAVLMSMYEYWYTEGSTSYYKWRPYSKYEYQYNSKDTLASEVEYVYDNSKLEWTPVEKVIYTYNTANKLLHSINSRWNGLGWIVKEKEELIYDTNDNCVDRTYTSWDSVYEVWKKGSKEQFSYNLLYNTNELLCPVDWDLRDAEISVNNILISYTMFDGDDDSSEWISYGGYTFYYSQIAPTKLSNGQSESLTVYPNPVVDQFNIKRPQNSSEVFFQLINIHGQVLFYRKIEGESVNVDVSDYESGVYFYLLSFDGKSVNGKLIKQ